MAGEESEAIWKVVGASVRGASHQRRGLPNQDAIAWLPESEDALPLVMAVSDGHSSPRCFRSDAGAALAVRCCAHVIRGFFDAQPGEAALSAIEGKVRECLPQQLERSWKDAVLCAIRDAPFSLAELEQLEKNEGGIARSSVEANPFVAYGATLLLVVVGNGFVLYVQLGDGDILAVGDAGEVSRPLPADERLFGNETTSLCLSEAWRDVRWKLETGDAARPALILVSTDGYSNSFRDDAGFLKVGCDLLDIIRSEGLAFVSEHLERWLEEATQAGSGDDITVGVLCRMEAVEAREQPAVSEATECGA
jgi:serine/threonine protein phosphatase PrpC